MPRLFSAYVIVDWSAAAKPTTGADSVWIGVLKRDVRFRLAFESFNPATRAEAEARLATLLGDFKKRSERALVGFDFPLGFPRGFAAAAKLKGEIPWRAAWDELAKRVVDKPTNINNRFNVAAQLNRLLTDSAFPFWGCPPKEAQTTLAATKLHPHGPGDLPEYRHGDLAAKATSSIWKTYYNGSVGGQALLGIPAVARIKKARGDAAKVWPFETGFKALSEADLSGVEVVLAEVYPSMTKGAALPGEVKDQTQVRVLAEHFARLDETGKLGDQFGPAKGVAADAVLDAEREEGWVLGAGW